MLERLRAILTSRSDQTGRPLRAYALFGVALLILTLLLERLESYFGLALLVPYLVLVVLAARWGGFGAAVFISLATIPLVDFFLLEPQHRLGQDTRLTAQVLLVLLAGLLLGWLMDGLRRARQRAEAAAASERAALAERDALLSLIAHDLRSPLSAVKARVQLAEMALQQDPVDPAAGLRHLNGAVPQVDRISRLLDDLLTTGRTDGGTLAVEVIELDLEPLARRVGERWRSDTRSHRVDLDLSVPLPTRADPDRMEQVLDNLLANAIKYSPAGSTVRLTGQVANGEVRLFVTDEGAGVPPEEQPQIFERYYRRAEHRRSRQPGLGLGLFITQQLVVAQGGRIWIESDIGRGSTFVVALPRVAEEDAFNGNEAEPDTGAETESGQQREPKVESRLPADSPS